ncbi:hypothetical protein SU65_09505 [Flavobacterium psychrophilum]|nr:hypothetical protein SU65_09505 [Flavobacterium psychrophilum]
MRIKIKLSISFIIFCYFSTFSQTKYYRIDISDGKSSLYTMNQFNNIVLESYRLVFNQFDYEKLTKKEQKIISFSQTFSSAIFLMPFTHEEGHRSVLTNLGIGSISKPFIDFNGVAKVTGISDETLKNLRDTQLPSYIRLHNGGLESDFDYLKKEDALFNFDEENYNVLYSDYFVRQFGVATYYLTTLIHLKTNIKESDNEEKDRDAVGHDIFGMIRHLHRPDMPFTRYTEWNDLTPDEQTYGRRIGFLSLLNYTNPNIWKKGNYNLSEKIKGNFSLNYSLAPFGDFIEQNAYLTINNKLKINPFIREYFNKSHTFLAAGINLHNLEVNNKFLVNGDLELWSQPKNLDFMTSQSDLGLGFKAEIGYNFLDINKKSVYLNLGLNYKTQGFMPASPSLDKDFRINFGLIISTKQ